MLTFQRYHCRIDGYELSFSYGLACPYFPVIKFFFKKKARKPSAWRYTLKFVSRVQRLNACTYVPHASPINLISLKEASFPRFIKWEKKKKYGTRILRLRRQLELNAASFVLGITWTNPHVTFLCLRDLYTGRRKALLSRSELPGSSGYTNVL